MALGRLSVVLDANIAKFESDLGRAARISQQQAQAMQRAFQGAAKNIAGSLTGALVGAVSIGTFAATIKRATDNMLQMGIAAKQVAMPTDQFTALSSAAKRADVDVQTFAQSIRKADLTLAQAQSGNKQAGGLFAQLGIDPKAIRDNQDLLNKVADSFAKYQDGAQKTAAAQMLFGRSGAAMIGFLDQGSAAIQAQAQHMRDLGVAFGPDAQAKLLAFDDAQKDFKDTLQGLTNSIAIALLPALQSATQFVQSFVGGLDRDKVSGFAAVINTLGRAGLVLAGSFETVGKAVGAAGAAAYLAVHGQFKDALGALREFGADTSAQWKKAADQIANFGQQAAKATGATSSAPKLAMPVLSVGAGARAIKAPKEPTDPTQALRDQLVQLTLNAKAYQLYQLAQKGATDSQLSYASSVIDTIDKLKAQNDAQAKLNDFLDQHRAELNGVTSAEQAFNETMEMANKALQAGAVSWLQFQRIATGALEDLNGKARDQFDQMTEFAKRAAQNMQDSLAAFLFDPFKGGLKGMLNGFADTLRQMAAQALAANIFGKLGAQPGGGFQSGSVLGTLFGWMGAGHADGGPVSAGRMYPVNERGPELLTVGSRDYLMMGAQGGRVTPYGAGGTIINNINVQPTSSRQTAEQIAYATTRRLQLAAARA